MNDRPLTNVYAISIDQSPFDSLRKADTNGEYWMARDLVHPLGYGAWEDFGAAINRARESYRNTGQDPDQAFSVHTEKGTGGRARQNYRLNRYACYLIAMNGDPSKPEIAAAQSYFVVKTREAEIAQFAPKLPTSYIDALKALVTSEEARAEAEAARLELEAPAKAWTTLGTGEGSWSMAEAAKILAQDHNIHTGQNRLFNLLEEQGWLFRRNGAWEPYQASVDAGWLVAKPQAYQKDGSTVLAKPQVRITPAGIQRILPILNPSKELV